MTDNIFTTMTAPITTQAAAIQQAQTAAQQSQHPWVPPNTTVVIPGTSGTGQENKRSAQVQPGKTVVLANPTNIIVGGNNQNNIAAPASVIAGKPVTIPSSAGLGNPQPPSTTDILVGAAAAASLVTNPVLVQGGGNRGVAPTPQAAGTTQAALNAKGTSTYNQYIIANAVSPDTKGQPSQITGQVETYQNWFTGVLGPLGTNAIIDQPTTTLIGTIFPAGSYLVLNPVSPLYSLSQVNQVYRGVYPSQGSPSGTTNVSLGVIVDKNFDIYTMNSSGVYVKTGQNYIAQQNAAVNLDTQEWISNTAKAGTVANVTAAHGGTGALNPGDAGYDGGFAANMANILSNKQAAAGIGGSVGINPITGNTEWIPTGQTAQQAAQNLAGKPTLYEGAVYGAGLNYNVAVAQNAIAKSAANAIAVTTGQVAINIGQGGNVSSITSGPYINAPISTPISSILTSGSNLESFNDLITTGNAITASQQQATQQNQLYASLQQQGGINSLGQIVNPYNINTQRDQWYAFEKTADQYEAMTNTAATPQNAQNNPNYNQYIQIYQPITPGATIPLSLAQQQAIAQAGSNPAYAEYLESLWSGTLVQGAASTTLGQIYGQSAAIKAISEQPGIGEALAAQYYGVNMGDLNSFINSFTTTPAGEFALAGNSQYLVNPNQAIGKNGTINVTGGAGSMAQYLFGDNTTLNGLTITGIEDTGTNVIAPPPGNYTIGNLPLLGTGWITEVFGATPVIGSFLSGMTNTTIPNSAGAHSAINSITNIWGNANTEVAKYTTNIGGFWDYTIIPGNVVTGKYLDNPYVATGLGLARGFAKSPLDFPAYVVGAYGLELLSESAIPYLANTAAESAIPIVSQVGRAALTPTAISALNWGKYALAGSMLGGMGYSVYAAPTPESRGEIIANTAQMIAGFKVGSDIYSIQHAETPLSPLQSIAEKMYAQKPVTFFSDTLQGLNTMGGLNKEGYTTIEIPGAADLYDSAVKFSRNYLTNGMFEETINNAARRFVSPGTPGYWDQGVGSYGALRYIPATERGPLYTTYDVATGIGKYIINNAPKLNNQILESGISNTISSVASSIYNIVGSNTPTFESRVENTIIPIAQSMYYNAGNIVSWLQGNTPTFESRVEGAAAYSASLFYSGGKGLIDVLAGTNLEGYTTTEMPGVNWLQSVANVIGGTLFKSGDEKFIRVYRGEPIEYFSRDVSGEFGKTEGKWFTTDPDYAAERAAGRGLSFGWVRPQSEIKPGQVVYVDVPKNRWVEFGLKPEKTTDVVLSKELVSTKKILIGAAGTNLEGYTTTEMPGVNWLQSVANVIGGMNTGGYITEEAPVESLSSKIVSSYNSLLNYDFGKIRDITLEDIASAADTKATSLKRGHPGRSNIRPGTRQAIGAGQIRALPD